MRSLRATRRAVGISLCVGGLLLAPSPPAAPAAPAPTTGDRAPASPVPHTPHTGRQAQARQAPAPLALAGTPAWVPIGSALDLDLALSGDTSGTELALTVRSRVGSRSAFDRTLKGEALGDAVATVTVPVSGLTAGARGTHRVSVLVGPPPAPDPDAPPTSPPPGGPTADPTTGPTEGPTTGGDTGTSAAPAALAVTQEGVYPLVVELRRPESEEPVGELVTYLVALDPAATRASLSVAWIWPMAVDAPRLPDGSVGKGLTAAVGPSGRIGQMVTALAEVPDVPVTLAPRGAVLDAWAELAASASPTAPEAPLDPPSLAAASLAALQAQAGLATRQVLAGTYARVSLPALAQARLGEEISAHLAEGADTLGSTLGIRPDPRTFLVSSGGIDARSLDVLREAGVDRLVIPQTSLTPVFEQLTPAHPFEIESRERSFLSAAPDATISALLGPDATGADASRGSREAISDAEAAQRFLADLAVVSLEAPSTARGVVIVPPLNWEPSTALLTTVLRGLADHPSLDPATLDGLFAGVEPAAGDTATRALQPTRPGRLALSRDAIERTRRRIDSFATVLDPNAEEPRAAARRLLLAEAEPFQRRGAEPSAADYMAGVDGVIETVVGSVRLPDAPSVTLTAQRGAIPLTIVNDSDRPLHVTLRLTSDKLLFPNGDTRELVLPPRSTTERVVVEARTSGSFPMLVEVTSPDGRLAIGSFEMTIRSTAVSGVALTITIGAGLFLVGWWGNHFRKSRRTRFAAEAGPPVP